MKSNLLIQDNEVKISKSPFAIYTNEQKIYDGRSTTIDMEFIMLKVQKGEMLAVDYVILEALSQLEFATSRMVTQYLILRGIHDMPQEQTSKRLIWLNKYNIVTRFRFESDEGQSNQRVYCLQKAGKYLLLSRKYECKWKLSDNTRSLLQMKEILVRNQLILTYQLKTTTYVNHAFEPSFRLRQSGNTLIPHAQVYLKEKSPKETHNTLLIEIIRNCEESMSILLSRLELYKEFYEWYTVSDVTTSIPQLVIVGEDDKHLFEIYKVIRLNNVMFKGIDVMYTSDLRLLDEDLRHSMIKWSIEKDVSANKNKPVINKLDCSFLG